MKSKRNFQYFLNKIFCSVGVIHVTQVSKKRGIWKEGKTDFSLLLSQLCLKYNLVSEVATNINTFGHYPQITDLFNLRYWLHRNRRVKLFILDELNVHAPRRRAMTTKNIGILQVIPEISKARARLIGIGQDLEGIDKDLRKQRIVRGLFIKYTRKDVGLISPLFSGRKIFHKIPATTVKFDPYETAPFTERPREEIMFKDKELQILYKWSKGASWRELFKHPNECNRFIRKQVGKLLEKTFTDSQQ